MVLTKCCRVWRKYKPRSILLESKEVPDHALLFESDIIAILGEFMSAFPRTRNAVAVNSQVYQLLVTDPAT